MAYECECCSVGEPQCALTSAQFNGVSETASDPNFAQSNLALTVDGVTATTAISGYFSVAGFVTSTTLEVTYTMTTPHNRVRGLRLWNQCGGDLNDFDGLGQFTAEFYAGVTLLTTQVFSGANGATPITLLIPGGVELNGVDRVVLRNIGKLSGSTAAPLWRELQLLELETVFPCRRRNGTLEWYDMSGDLVPTSELVECGEPVVIPDLMMTGGAFGDDPSGLAENMCTVTPAPTSTTGWTLSSGCYDPTTGAPTMTWSSPLSGVEMDYGHATQASGGVNVTFTSPTLGAITWPVNTQMMALGESRWSNVFGGIYRARVTYISGPVHTAVLGYGTIQSSVTSRLELHLANPNPSATGPFIRYRLDFFRL